MVAPKPIKKGAAMIAGLRRRVRSISDSTVLVLLLGIGIGMTIGSARAFNIGASRSSPWWDDFLQNFGTEMFGAFLTFFLIEVLVHYRRADEAQKAVLIPQMSSPDNAFAREAARQLQARGWLEDGSMKGAYLFGANLQGSSLVGANLQAVQLIGANLQGTNLRLANLQDALLVDANLREADLTHADLRRANLLRADLHAVDFHRASLSEDTRLPDASMWTPDTDMTRFTDPDHPEFYESK